MSNALALGAPPMFKTPPWPHQLEAFKFATPQLATMLAADMGTGKGKMAIDLAQNRRANPILIACPKSVVSVWPSEFDKHCMISTRVVALQDGSVKARAERLMQEIDVAHAKKQPLAVVVNYEAMIQEPLKAHLLKIFWELIILDESHRIKAPGGKVSWMCNRLRDQSLYRLCLTGTPMPHSPLDLYAQYRFLDPSIFGKSFIRFKAKYAVMGGYKQKQVMDYQHVDDLEAKMRSIMFRVKSEDVQDLPDTADMVRTCELSDKVFRMYRKLKEDFVVEVEQGVVTAGNALTRLLRLQQLTSGFIMTDQDPETGADPQMVQIDNGKALLLKEALEDLPPGEPVVVFCRFRQDLNVVQVVAQEIGSGSLELSGRVNELKRWQDGEHPILAVQIQSGGVGIDLTRARYAIYYSLGFSLGDYLQSRKRVHRPGQTRHVTYLHLLARGTVDETVMKALERRHDVVKAILEDCV